ncbi:dicarboxylate/amino acid:cation symporter [Sphingomonas sp. PL20]|uniref:dicarboxylate/amino acid:cation symporter n=1 Tax=Sphingomonas sp. PL20 TaxID=2760712 RepID=UPI001AE1DE9D
MYFQVLTAIVLGALIGHFWPTTGEALKPLGDGFIKLVKMIIAPVIFLSLVSGIAGMRELKSVGRVALKAFGYFLFFSTLALILGLVVANVVHPGTGMNINPATLDAGSVADYAKQAHETTFVGFLMSIIPNTMVSALTEGSILQTLFVAVLFGIAVTLVGEPAEPVLDLIERVALIVFRIVGILMRAAPVGAFGAIAFTVGKYGASSLINLGGLVATFYFTSIVFVLVILGAVARLHGFSILRLLAYLKAELLLVLGTSSSEAALPNLITKLEAAGCDKGVVGLVVPTGYSFNLDGTNIYMTLAALFIAQACNVHLPIGDQLLLVGVAMLSSKGAAGVTGAGFITLAATLSIVPSVPVAGMALILGVDRFMSECRSLTNFIGNAVAAIVVARWEGKLDRAKLEETLRGNAPLRLK